MESYKGENRKVKRCVYQKEVNEDMNRNKKLFWKEVSQVNGWKVENCNRTKNRNGKLTLGKDEAQRIWKYYFEDLYDIDIQEQVAA